MKPKQRIREWWKANLNVSGPCELAPMSVQCVADLERDDAFCRAFVREFLPALALEIGSEAVRGDGVYRHRIGTKLMTGEQLRQEIDAEETPWARWIHQDGKGGGVPLLDMNRGQLIAASEDRKRRGDTNYKDAAFFKAIADTLNDGQAVGDVWRANDLADLYERITLKIKADVVLTPALTERVAR